MELGRLPTLLYVYIIVLIKNFTVNLYISTVHQIFQFLQLWDICAVIDKYETFCNLGVSVEVREIFRPN